jgi:hypothetical protein
VIDRNKLASNWKQKAFPGMDWEPGEGMKKPANGELIH